MLMYGFIHQNADDVFSDEDPDSAVLLTEHGELIGGTEYSTRIIEPRLGDDLTEDLMKRRIAQLMEMRNTISEELRTVTPIRPRLMELYNENGFDSATHVLSEFLDAMNNGYGDPIGDDEFLRIMRLYWEFDQDDTDSEYDHEAEAEEQALASPHKIVRAASDDYIPRKIGDLTDVDVIRRARDAALTVLLDGQPGSGKTALCEAAHGDELVTISCHEGMTLADVVGQWMPVENSPGNFTWHDGPLVTAMLEGRPVLLDDFSWASMEVQAALLPVLDHRRSLTVMDRSEGQNITATDGFVVILTQNPDMGIGIIDPIIDRVSFTVTVPTDLDTAQRLGVSPDLLAVAYTLEEQTKQREAEGGIGWVPSIRTLLEATTLQEVYGLEFAASAFLSSCPIADEDYRSMVHSLLQTQLGNTQTVSSGLVSRA